MQIRLIGIERISWGLYRFGFKYLSMPWTGLDIQIRTRLLSNSEWYIRYACAARRRARCECPFEAGEIVAVNLALTRPVWIYPEGLSRPDAPTSKRRRLYCINYLMRRGRFECSDWQTCVPIPARCVLRRHYDADASGLNRPWECSMLIMSLSQSPPISDLILSKLVASILQKTIQPTDNL